MQVRPAADVAVAALVRPRRVQSDRVLGRCDLFKIHKVVGHERHPAPVDPVLVRQASISPRRRGDPHADAVQFGNFDAVLVVGIVVDQRA